MCAASEGSGSVGLDVGNYVSLGWAIKKFFEMMNMGCFELKLVEFLLSDFPGCFSVPISPRI